MRLQQLNIQHFRNLAAEEITPGEGVNLIVGANASGKTSLLESIYYLSHLRSFRSKQFSDIVQRGEDAIQLYGKLSDEAGKQIPIGLKRNRQKLVIRANQQNVHRVADITALFPVIAVHPDSYQLITGGPGERRSYLDWGVFHVEHGFFDAWQRYRTALNQRNAALRANQDDRYCRLWDVELTQAAETIDRFRSSYVESLLPTLVQTAERFFPHQVLSFEYRRGWASDTTLDQVLSAQLRNDRHKGFTYHGPHRCDLVVKVDGHSAQNGISRGQQKSLVALLKLSQASHFSEIADQRCVLLYDDLPAELDSHHRGLVLDMLSAMKVQLFLSTIEREQLDVSAWENPVVFHVEHGSLRALQD